VAAFEREGALEKVRKTATEPASSAEITPDTKPCTTQSTRAARSPLAVLTLFWRRLHGWNAFGANTALNATTNVVQAVLGMLTGIMAARLLGPHGRGELAAIQTWPTLIGYLSLLGTGDALVYYAAREPARTGVYLGSAVLLALVVCGPVVLLAYLVLPLALSAQSPSVVIAARWYLLIIPLVPLQMLPFCTLRGLGEFGAWNALRTAPNLLWLLILAVAWCFASSRPSRLADFFLLGMALIVFLQAFVVRRRVRGSMSPGITNFAPLLRYGLPCVLSTFPQILNLRLDQMVMTAFFPPMELGLYVVAVAWAGAINPLLTAMAAAQFPEVAAKSDWSDRARVFVRGTRLAALIAVLMGVVLTIATPWAIRLLFGAGFRGAVPSALILMPAGAVYGVNGVVEDGLRGLGRPTLVMQAEMTGLVVTGVCLAVLLRPFGILGAAIASLLGYSTVGVSLLLSASKVADASAADLLVPRVGEIRAYAGHLKVLVRHLLEVPGA
jgi:O-antigen/teichoic acid export membrane protein